MSYILEALKRAEHERSASLAGVTDTASTPGTHARLRPTTLALAAATVFLAGVGVAALLFRSPPMAAPTADSAVPYPSSRIAAGPAAGPIPASAAPAATPAAVLPSEPTAKPEVEAAADPAAEPLPLDDYESLDDIAPVFQGSAVMPTAAPVARTPAAPAAAAPEPPPGAVDGAPQRTLPPTLNEMPADFRAGFPDIDLQVHVHDTDPARRWVMIGNRRYPEGGTLDSGPRIAEITADGVIFELGGQRTFWPLAR